MSELSIRRKKLISQIQRKERQEYLSRMRQQLFARWREQQYKTKMQEDLYAAFIAYQQQNGPQLDIYVNIQRLLDEEICISRSSTFAYMLSIFLFTSLTSSNDTITYMIETNAVKQWEKMNFILKCNSKCEELLYQRMRVFLEIICAKYNIKPFHYSQFQGELKSIFTQQTTLQLMNTPLPYDKDSQFYSLMETYISLVPPSHLIPFFISGFASQILLCNSQALTLTLLRRIESARSISTALEKAYQQFHQKWLEYNLIKEINF